MKKLLVAFAAVAAFSAHAAETLTVAATPVPHAEILEFVKPALAAQGVDLKVKVFTDYVQPNVQVAEGRLDANFFQHQPYLDEFNASRGTTLVSIAGSAIHVAWHRTWLKALRNRPPASLPRKIKANRVVNRIIWITFLAASVFGIVGWFIQNNGPRVNLFLRVHVILSICWLMGIVVHLVFHRKWIFSAITRQWINKASGMEKIPAGLAKE